MKPRGDPPLQLFGGRLAALGGTKAAATIAVVSLPWCCCFIVLWRAYQPAHRPPGHRPGEPGAIIFRAGQGGRLGRSLKALAAVAAAMRCSMAGLTRLGFSIRRAVRAGAAILKAIVVFSAVSALITGVLAPSEPVWRLVALCNASAKANCTPADRHGGGVCHRRGPHRDQPLPSLCR